MTKIVFQRMTSTENKWKKCKIDNLETCTKSKRKMLKKCILKRMKAKRLILIRTIKKLICRRRKTMIGSPMSRKMGIRRFMWSRRIQRILILHIILMKKT